MPLEMRNDLVLIKRIKSPTSTPGGIILPGTARELPQIGIIISVGPRKNPGLKKGDKVLLSKFAGMAYFPNPLEKEEPLYILRIDEILAILEGD